MPSNQPGKLRWPRVEMWLLRRLRRHLTPSPVQRYRASGRIPWSDGYMEARQQFVAASLSDPSLMAAFARREALPAGYGLGFDERCVEYPWALARIPPDPGRVLDAGSTLNHAAVLDHPLWQDKVLHIVTLAPDGLAFWERGISYLYEDLRDLPLQDNLYDTVVCLSTLEHVGLDNSGYTRQMAHREQRPRDALLAVDELRRVLKPGGSLLLTIPYGEPLRLPTQWVFDEGRLAEVVDRFGPTSVEETFYRYDSGGWQISEQAACHDCAYVPWIMTPAAQRPPAFPVQADGAAAARAVACLKLVKPA